MFRSDVNRKPCPQEIQLRVARFDVLIVQCRQKLLQHFMHSAVII
jgi:hypothetical protein